MILAVFLSSRGPQKHPAQNHRNRFRNTGGRSSPQPNPTTRGYKRWTFGSRTRRNALEWVRTAKVRLTSQGTVPGYQGQSPLGWLSREIFGELRGVQQRG